MDDDRRNALAGEPTMGKSLAGEPTMGKSLAGEPTMGKSCCCRYPDDAGESGCKRVFDKELCDGDFLRRDFGSAKQPPRAGGRHSESAREREPEREAIGDGEGILELMESLVGTSGKATIATKSVWEW